MITRMLDRIRDWFDPGVFGGARRSSQWREVRERHLQAFPDCEVCGGVKKITVHHILPFHVYPDYELDPFNLITLCTAKKKGINCHLLVGHRGNYRKINDDVVADAKYIKRLIG